MSATQSFIVTVQSPQPPVLSTPLNTTGGMQLSVTGDAGPDYVIQTKTNLTGQSDWLPMFTNVSATPPFQWNNSNISFSKQFFRIQLAP